VVGARLMIGYRALEQGAAALTPNLARLITASICVGLGQLLGTVGQQSFIAEQADRYATDGAFGTLTSAASIGQIAEPLIAAWIATANLRSGAPEPDTTVALFVAALLTLLAVPSCWILNRFPGIRRRCAAATGNPPARCSEPPVSGEPCSSAVSCSPPWTCSTRSSPAWAAQNSVPVTVVG